MRLERDFAPGSRVTVSATAANIQDESQTIATVKSGQQLTVVQSKDEWILVRIGGMTGWISKADVK